MGRNQTLKEIFTPSFTKIVLAVIVTTFGHLLLVVETLRQAGHGLDIVRQFWVTNLINALPYLETDNVVLKFLTFFTISYALVWIFSRVFTFLGNLQHLTAKRLRERS